MAVNDSRSMNADFHQGTIDSTYIQLSPGWSNLANPPTERLTWPRYTHVEEWSDPPFFEAHVIQARQPVERKAVYGSDPRF